MAEDEPEIHVAVLGPLELSVAGVAVTGLPRKERALVELLALRPGRPVPLHEIADAIWEGSPPKSSRKGMQVLAYRLRRRVDDCVGGGPIDLIGTEGEAYRLQVDRRSIDAVRFELLVEHARRALTTGDPATVVAGLDEALALWRGEPLPDLGDSDLGVAERTRLVEMRRAAEDDRCDLRLALGEHDALVGELETALAEDRLRERRWRQLMVALYRSGRQADALRAYQRVRALLVDQLGIEPGPELRRLEADIINHDPGLGLAPTRVVRRAGAGPVVSGGQAWAERQRAVPMVARRGELDRLRDLWRAVRQDGVGGVVVVAGEAGIGKSRLVAELVADAGNEDVAVAVRCRRGGGVGPLREALAQAAAPRADGGTDPVEPEQLFRALLDAVSAADHALPALVVIDDLHEADDRVVELVRSGLEDVAAARVLVVATCRDSERPSAALVDLFADLHRVARHDRIGLAGLGTDDAVALLLEGLGRAIAPESDVAVAALALECGGRPLYLLEMARHLLATEVIDADGRWHGDLGVAAVGVPVALRTFVDGRLARIPEPTRRFLAGAAVVGPEFDLEVAAAATELTIEVALDHIDAVIEAGFVSEAISEPNRYAFAAPIERALILERLSSARREAIEARVGATTEGADGGLEEAAEARLRTGDLSGAWQLFGDAAEAARSDSDIRALASAAVGAAQVLVNLGVRHPPIIELLLEALGALPADDPLRADVRAALLRELLWAGRWHEAAALPE